MVTLKNKRISGRLGEAMKQIYICEDTITGIYSALHDAWKECRDTQAGVELRGRTQRQLFCEYRIVEESESIISDTMPTGRFTMRFFRQMTEKER